MELNELSERVIGAAIEVHKVVSPGLLEEAYATCLCRELSIRELGFKRQVPIPIEYKGVKLESSYRVDILVDDRIVLELKSVEALTDLHSAQLMTYLKQLHCKLGLLLNFNVPRMMDGVKRVSIGAPNL